LNVNFSYCIKSGFKSYNNYKQKAIKEISGNKCFKVTIKAIDNNNREDDNEINNKNKNNEIKEWSFYACYTQSEYLRNYVK
jgi:hypothetical protein